MAVNPRQFEEKPWRKPLRHRKEDIFVLAGRGLMALGLLAGYPQNPVFILGSPRSGTSIFNKMISECPDVADLSEAIHIWSPGDRDPDCDHVKVAGDVAPADERRIKGAFGFYQRMYGKAVFVNKCPRSSVRIGYINAMFPDARYIHVYRDGRAVVNSILDISARERFRQQIPLGGFCKPANWRELAQQEPLECHARQWSGIMQAIRTDSSVVQADRWLDVRYEDFCRAPSEVMQRVFSFIGASPTQALLDRIGDMPLAGDDKWRSVFNEEEKSRMTDIMAPELMAYGYAL